MSKDSLHEAFIYSYVVSEIQLSSLTIFLVVSKQIKQISMLIYQNKSTNKSATAPMISGNQKNEY